MSLRDPLDLLRYDDLPEDLQLLAHYCGGVDQMKNVLRHLGGHSFTIPHLRTLTTLTERYIREEARAGHGGNVKKVALKLGVSRNYVAVRLRGEG